MYLKSLHVYIIIYTVIFLTFTGKSQVLLQIVMGYFILVKLLYLLIKNLVSR